MQLLQWMYLDMHLHVQECLQVIPLLRSFVISAQSHRLFFFLFSPTPYFPSTDTLQITYTSYSFSCYSLNSHGENGYYCFFNLHSLKRHENSDVKKHMKQRYSKEVDLLGYNDM